MLLKINREQQVTQRNASRSITTKKASITRKHHKHTLKHSTVAKASRQAHTNERVVNSTQSAHQSETSNIQRVVDQTRK